MCIVGLLVFCFVEKFFFLSSGLVFERGTNFSA